MNFILYNMYFYIVSLYAWLIVLLSFFTLFPIAVLIWLLTVLFDKRLTWLHQFSSFWASTYIWTNPFWSVDIIDRKKIDPKQTYVMVCNHQSMLDIIVLYRLFAHFKWVSKKELFSIPFIGWNMRLNRYISVDRGSKMTHLKMMKSCEQNLKRGNSIMIFPEGTRSPDGEIHSFKDGAFKIALAAKMPVLPILLEGSSDLLPKHGLILRNKNKIKVKILDPIPYASFEGLSTKELSDKVREEMVKEFDKLRARSQEPRIIQNWRYDVFFFDN
jgi:1-acyl-sn-glycerol-3-phosphate acyltransferase